MTTMPSLPAAADGNDGSPRKFTTQVPYGAEAVPEWHEDVAENPMWSVGPDEFHGAQPFAGFR
jgi:hypothetical protein